MTAVPAPKLQPCVVKGCSWRGLDPYACPLHDDDAWDRQWLLLPGDLSGRRHTRYRR